MSTPRIHKLRATLSEAGVPAALFQNPVDVGYLTGFTGSTASLVVTPERAVFITDGRYQDQAVRECAALETAITRTSDGYGGKIREVVRQLGISELGVEGDFLSVNGFAALQKTLSEEGEPITLKPLPNFALGLRRIKDADELSRIRAACAMVDRAFDYFLTLLQPGKPERQVAAELEFWAKMQGAEKEAFDTIVASGVRSALPHGRASEKPLATGEFITLDFGVKLNGYNSDLTRTVFLGEPTPRHREVYQAVLDSQLAAIAAIKSGVTGKSVDSAARDLLTARGLGDAFKHGLGHGLGLLVHDHPALSPREEIILHAGMVLTVEPGVYLEGWGGVRIEDDILVTDSGCKLLTHAPKQLIAIPG